MKVASLLFLITFFISCNISNVNKDEIVAEVNGEKIYLSELSSQSKQEIFDLLNTLSTPNFPNSFTATGVVISFPNTKSRFASINCPAFTLSKPACAANIFCVMVIPIFESSPT